MYTDYSFDPPFGFTVAVYCYYLLFCKFIILLIYCYDLLFDFTVYGLLLKMQGHAFQHMLACLRKG